MKPIKCLFATFLTVLFLFDSATAASLANAFARPQRAEIVNLTDSSMTTQALTVWGVAFHQILHRVPRFFSAILRSKISQFLVTGAFTQTLWGAHKEVVNGVTRFVFDNGDGGIKMMTLIKSQINPQLGTLKVVGDVIDGAKGAGVQLQDAIGQHVVPIHLANGIEPTHVPIVQQPGSYILETDLYNAPPAPVHHDAINALTGQGTSAPTPPKPSFDLGYYIHHASQWIHSHGPEIAIGIGVAIVAGLMIYGIVQFVRQRKQRPITHWSVNFLNRLGKKQSIEDGKRWFNRVGVLGVVSFIVGVGSFVGFYIGYDRIIHTFSASINPFTLILISSRSALFSALGIWGAGLALHTALFSIKDPYFKDEDHSLEKNTRAAWLASLPILFLTVIGFMVPWLYGAIDDRAPWILISLGGTTATLAATLYIIRLIRKRDELDARNREFVLSKKFAQRDAENSGGISYGIGEIPKVLSEEQYQKSIKIIQRSMLALSVILFAVVVFLYKGPTAAAATANHVFQTFLPSRFGAALLALGLWGGVMDVYRRLSPQIANPKHEVIGDIVTTFSLPVIFIAQIVVVWLFGSMPSHLQVAGITIFGTLLGMGAIAVLAKANSPNVFESNLLTAKNESELKSKSKGFVDYIDLPLPQRLQAIRDGLQSLKAEDLGSAGELLSAYRNVRDDIRNERTNIKRKPLSKTEKNAVQDLFEQIDVRLLELKLISSTDDLLPPEVLEWSRQLQAIYDKLAHGVTLNEFKAIRKKVGDLGDMIDRAALLDEEAHDLLVLFTGVVTQIRIVKGGRRAALILSRADEPITTRMGYELRADNLLHYAANNTHPSIHRIIVQTLEGLEQGLSGETLTMVNGAIDFTWKRLAEISAKNPRLHLQAQAA